MDIKTFFDTTTATFTHTISDPDTKCAAVIDSVADYEPNSGRISTKSADMVIKYIQDNDLKLEWILDTHIHADHLTASKYIKDKLGGKIGIGSGIKKVLNYWVPVFNTQNDTPTDASQFDALFEDDDSFKLGNISVRVMHTPGHTPACITYIFNEKVAFVGDTLFMPDLGTARADFPGGSAAELYQSIQKILSLPDNTKLYLCHDYPPEPRKEVSFLTTVSDQRKHNKCINDSISEDEYVIKRANRDKTLPVPKLLFPAIQVNMRLGDCGTVEKNGTKYIKIPINTI
jgi:glyoxylase-like metal-dependent hydrolase (beta-lactamase superfamily II)